MVPEGPEPTSVHGHASNGGPDIEPTATSSLAKLSILVVGIARDTDCSTRILMYSPNLAALELDSNVLAGHNFGAVLSCLFLL